MQNHVQAAPDEPAACDGVGELWFESDEAMQQALGSPEFAAAVEEAKNFLDMEKTALLVVEEKAILDAVATLTAAEIPDQAFELGNVVLRCGITLPGTRLAYRTYRG